MCYDISITAALEALAKYFPGFKLDGPITLDFNLTSHILGPYNYPQHGIIYRNREDQELHMRYMNWGIVPHYIKEQNNFKEYSSKREWWLNIKSERLLDDKKSYWHQIRNRRCLVPVTGIYEHRHIKGWKNKVPYFIHPSDQEVFFLPGLYAVAEVLDESTGEIITHRTFGIITRAANSIMKMIHNGGPNSGRMPLFLPPEMTQAWLKEDLQEDEYRSILNYEIPSENLSYKTTFSIRGSKPRPDGKLKHEEWVWENLPELAV